VRSSEELVAAKNRTIDRLQATCRELSAQVQQSNAAEVAEKFK
jgi:hypothetical protein